jgi:hypothetical protein
MERVGTYVVEEYLAVWVDQTNLCKVLLRI